MIEAQHGVAKDAPPLQQGERRQRPAPSGHALPVGRPKGVPNKLTVTLKAAVERAARDCHPQGLAGWLVDRANGSIGDRQIFAALVGKVIPIQVNQSVEGGISINLNWLGGRAIGTATAQTQVTQSQPVDLIEDAGGKYQIVDQHTQPAGAGQGAEATAQEAAGATQGQGG